MTTSNKELGSSKKRVWEFDRYVDGRLMAEGVRISLVRTFEEACRAAVSLASRGSVLVLRPSEDGHYEGLGLNRLAQCNTDSAAGAIPRVNPIATRIASQVVQNVCELPDYNSPEDQPDLVMCTVRELEACVLRAFEANAPETPAFVDPDDRPHSLTDEAIRKRWRIEGGSFHGPNIEHGTMPEALLLPLLRRLISRAGVSGPPYMTPEEADTQKASAGQCGLCGNHHSGEC